MASAVTASSFNVPADEVLQSMFPAIELETKVAFHSLSDPIKEEIRKFCRKVLSSDSYRTVKDKNGRDIYAFTPGMKKSRRDETYGSGVRPMIFEEDINTFKGILLGEIHTFELSQETKEEIENQLKEELSLFRKENKPLTREALRKKNDELSERRKELTKEAIKEELQPLSEEQYNALIRDMKRCVEVGDVAFQLQNVATRMNRKKAAQGPEFFKNHLSAAIAGDASPTDEFSMHLLIKLMEKELHTIVIDNKSTPVSKVVNKKTAADIAERKSKEIRTLESNSSKSDGVFSPHTDGGAATGFVSCSRIITSTIYAASEQNLLHFTKTDYETRAKHMLLMRQMDVMGLIKELKMRIEPEKYAKFGDTIVSDKDMIEDAKSLLNAVKELDVQYDLTTLQKENIDTRAKKRASEKAHKKGSAEDSEQAKQRAVFQGILEQLDNRLDNIEYGFAKDIIENAVFEQVQFGKVKKTSNLVAENMLRNVKKAYGQYLHQIDPALAGSAFFTKKEASAFEAVLYTLEQDMKANNISPKEVYDRLEPYLTKNITAIDASKTIGLMGYVSVNHNVPEEYKQRFEIKEWDENSQGYKTKIVDYVGTAAFRQIEMYNEMRKTPEGRQHLYALTQLATHHSGMTSAGDGYGSYKTQYPTLVMRPVEVDGEVINIPHFNINLTSLENLEKASKSDEGLNMEALLRFDLPENVPDDFKELMGDAVGHLTTLVVDPKFYFVLDTMGSSVTLVNGLHARLHNFESVISLADGKPHEVVRFGLRANPVDPDQHALLEEQPNAISFLRFQAQQKGYNEFTMSMGGDTAQSITM